MSRGLGDVYKRQFLYYKERKNKQLTQNFILRNNNFQKWRQIKDFSEKQKLRELIPADLRWNVKSSENGKNKRKLKTILKEFHHFKV